MKSPTNPGKAAKRALEVPGRPKVRSDPLTQAEVDNAADEQEVATGEPAGARAVYKLLGNRGSLSTISDMLKARRQEAEAVQAVLDDDGRADGPPPRPDLASGLGGGVRTDAAQGKPRAAPSTATQKLIFEVSILRRVVRDQGRTLAALEDRLELLELRQAPAAGDGVPIAETHDDVPATGSGDDVDGGGAPKPRMQRSGSLSREEKDRLLAEILRVIAANGGAARKGELYEGLSADWKVKLDREKLYDFAKSRGKVGLKLRFAEGSFTPGSDATIFLRAMKENSATNNPRTLARDRKMAAIMFMKKAVNHLNMNPGKKFSDRELFDIVTKQIGGEKMSHRVVDAKALFDSLRNRYYREERKLAAGETLPKGRTLLFVGDRSFTKA